MPFGSRNFLQVRVGKTHTIQVLIHLRHTHLQWYNLNEDEYTRQILKIISRRVLPVECYEDINPPKKEDATTKATTGASKKKKGPSNRKRKSDDVKKENFFKKSTKKGKFKAKGKAMKANDDQVHLKERKYLHSIDCKILYGDDLQITYKMEQIETRHFACLSCVSQSSSSNREHQTEEDKRTTKSSRHVSTFQSLRMIPKRIVLWCFPFDVMNPSDPNLELNGFVRPDMIPLSQIFSDTQV